MLFYIVRHLDSIASYLPIGLHLGFFHSWPSLGGGEHMDTKCTQESENCKFFAL